jgi:hypothetical protein
MDNWDYFGILARIFHLDSVFISISLFTVLQYLCESVHFCPNPLLASCFTEAGFVALLRTQPAPSSPQASHPYPACAGLAQTVELTAMFFKLAVRTEQDSYRLSSKPTPSAHADDTRFWPRTSPKNIIKTDENKQESIDFMEAAQTPSV